MILMQPRFAEAATTMTDLQARLQTAIRLELSTIPLYLYAMWTVSDTSNDAFDRIREVVVEEMLHMTIACNLANFCKSPPAFAQPGTVPVYPGALPGSVESQLIAHLAPFSHDLVTNIFMIIEEPEGGANLPSGTITIGKFYKDIASSMAALFVADPSQFDTTGSKQVANVGFEAAENFVIKGVDMTVGGQTTKDFSAAIDIIVEQGEGSSTGFDEDGDLAHYFKFAELSKGAKLVPGSVNPNPPQNPTPADKFLYSGALNMPTTIRKVVADPSRVLYQTASNAVQTANDDFCRFYTNLLKKLQAGFNGDGSVGDQIGSMFTLSTKADAVMALDLDADHKAGPSFEWLE